MEIERPNVRAKARSPKTEAAARSPRPPKPERDAQRREEIIEAARRCVLLHGFHAAGMALVAKTAGMSVGQIYRYFPNKEAIIHAIVERLTTQRIAWIVGNEGTADMAEMLASRIPSGGPHDADDLSLLLEVTAEATRNAEVADIVRKADRRLRDQAVALVRANHPGMTKSEATARVEFIAVLSDGTAFRRVADQNFDKAKLASLFRDAINRALAPKQ